MLRRPLSPRVFDLFYIRIGYIPLLIAAGVMANVMR